jgi:hypothetical protein
MEAHRRCRDRFVPRVAAALLAALFSFGCTGRSEKAFTNRVAERIRAEHGSGKVVVTGPLTIEIVEEDGGRHTVSLDNLWRTCRPDPEGCGEALDRFVRMVGQLPTGASATPLRGAVRATIKDRTWVEEVGRQVAQSPPEKARGNRVLVRPLVADLFVVYVIDLPDGMRMMSANDLPELEMQEDEVDGVALANMERDVVGMPHQPVEPGSSVHVLRAGDSYEASRLLLHDRWRGLRQEVKGDLLVSAPARDTVLFVGSGEKPAEVERFLTLTREIAQSEHHPVSATVLRWTERGWEPARPGRP